MDYGLPGSSVHEVSQTKIWEWVATSFFRGSFQPRAQTCTSHTGRKILDCWATREAPAYFVSSLVLYLLTHSSLFIYGLNGSSFQSPENLSMLDIAYSHHFLPSHSPCFFFKIFIYIKWGLLPNRGTQSSHYGGFSWCRTWALSTRTSIVVA